MSSVVAAHRRRVTLIGSAQDRAFLDRTFFSSDKATAPRARQSATPTTSVNDLIRTGRGRFRYRGLRAGVRPKERAEAVPVPRAPVLISSGYKRGRRPRGVTTGYAPVPSLCSPRSANSTNSDWNGSLCTTSKLAVFDLNRRGHQCI